MRDAKVLAGGGRMELLTGIAPEGITLVGMNASVAPDEMVEGGSRIRGPGG